MTFTWGPSSSATVTTDFNGVATTAPVTLPTDDVTAIYAIVPSRFELNRNGLSADETETVTPTVLTDVPTQLLISPVTATSGLLTTTTAKLQTTSGAAVAGATVTFAISGGASLGTGTTNANGDVSVTWTPGPGFSGTYTVTFAGTSAYLPTTATDTFVVNKATTAMSPLTVPSSAFVGHQLSVSTTLSRVSPPSGALSGVPIAFTLAGAATNPGGATTLTLPATTTDAAGTASATFELAARGQYTVTAQFAGDASLSSVSRTATFSVYQRTYLVVNEAHGVAGALTQVSASLFGDGAFTLPVADQTLQFSFTGKPTPPTALGTTNAQGVATVSVNFPAAGDFVTTATFANLADFFVDGNGNQIPTTSTAAVHVTQAVATLDPLQLATIEYVGDTMNVVTALTRVSAPSGAVANAPITFTLIGPAGPNSVTATQTAMTTGTGFVSTQFTLAARGQYTVAADFASSASLQSASVSQLITVYQKARLTIASPASITAGQPVTLTATLATVPGLVGVANQFVNFSFGGAIPNQAVPTNPTGVATVTVTFPNTGPIAAQASFTNIADLFANRNGQISDETDSTTVTVTAAATSLSPVDAPQSALVGGSLAVSATLSRVDGIAIPFGTPIVFTLTGPGNTTAQLTGMTNANGVATATFTPAVRGAYSVTAAFATNGSLLASTSVPAPVPVYQPTSLALPASVTAAASAPVTVTATLTTVPGGAPVAGQPVDFTFSGGGTLPAAQTGVLTDASGAATITIVVATPKAFLVHASFLNGADFFTNSAGAIPPVAATATATVSVTTAPTSLANLIAPPSALVGGSLPVSTTLTRNDGYPVSAGLDIVFTLTAPDGGTTTLTGKTNAVGFVSVTFAPMLRGAHSISASFAGDSSALLASTSNTADVPVYQRTSLVVPAVTGNAGAPVTVTTTLTTVPGGAPVAGQPVDFTFSGGGTLPAAQTGVLTDATGVARITIVVATPNAFTVHASFLNGADFFTNSAGAIPAVAASATAPVTVTAAATSLSTLSAPPSALVDGSLPVSTTLTRTDGLPVSAGLGIVFTLTAPGGGTTTLTGQTNAAGFASVTFTPLTRGAHSISASFAGGSALVASTSTTANVPVYQRTLLVVPAANGVAAETDRGERHADQRPGRRTAGFSDGVLLVHRPGHAAGAADGDDERVGRGDDLGHVPRGRNVHGVRVVRECRRLLHEPRRRIPRRRGDDEYDRHGDEQPADVHAASQYHCGGHRAVGCAGQLQRDGNRRRRRNDSGGLHVGIWRDVPAWHDDGDLHGDGRRTRKRVRVVHRDSQGYEGAGIDAAGEHHDRFDEPGRRDRDVYRLGGGPRRWSEDSHLHAGKRIDIRRRHEDGQLLGERQAREYREWQLYRDCEIRAANA